MSEVDRYFHEVWLGMEQPVDGLVVSIPVLVDAQCIERRAVLAANRPDAIAAADELFDDVQPQKAAAAGNKCVHKGSISCEKSCTRSVPSIELAPRPFHKLGYRAAGDPSTGRLMPTL